MSAGPCAQGCKTQRARRCCRLVPGMPWADVIGRYPERKELSWYRVAGQGENVGAESSMMWRAAMELLDTVRLGLL